LHPGVQGRSGGWIKRNCRSGSWHAISVPEIVYIIKNYLDDALVRLEYRSSSPEDSVD